LRPFDWVAPKTLADAVALLGEPDSRAVAGGTAIMLMMKAGIFRPLRLVSLQAVEARFSAIDVDSNGALRIGAMASLAALEHSTHVAAGFPALAAALRELSNVRIRNVARVGGALAHGDPHMDLPPVLAVLGARARIVGPGGPRDLAVEELYAGYYETTLRPAELIAEVTVPPRQGRKAAYLKCTSRSADDWPALGVAAAFDLAAGGTIRNVRLVVSAAVDKLTRLQETERLLEGAVVDEAALRRAGDCAAEEASPLADAHGSAGYKRELLRVCLGRTVRRALSTESREN
jgi:carbon-monoxide dehydrogenase medium subunit